MRYRKITPLFVALMVVLAILVIAFGLIRSRSAYGRNGQHNTCQEHNHYH